MATLVLARVAFNGDYFDNFVVSGKHLSGKSDLDVTGVLFIRSKLSKVPNHIFKKFQNLLYLDISYAGISRADSRTIENCGSLRYLDASFNDISRVAETFLSSCKNLIIVNLDSNLITSVSPCSSFFKRQPFLRSFVTQQQLRQSIVL